MGYIIMLSVLVVILAGAVVYLFMSSRRGKTDERDALLHQRLDALLSQMNQRLDSVSQQVGQQLAENRQSAQQATQSVFSQVQSFTKGMTELQESVKLVQEKVKQVSSFQEIFRSPKLRGIWGEASLQSVLGQYFPKEMYQMQYYFKTGEAVDAVLKLPNGLVLPIDSKFNWENFEKMVNAESDINRDIHKKVFYADVKKKVEEIASKYILPSESTTDLALMYVPAETVYYEIINNVKDADIPAYARSKKVILVSPNTFYLTVTAVLHWFKDVEFSKQTKEIMKKLDRVVIDGGKLADDFRVLGKHLGNAQSAYTESENRLSLMVDRVKNVIELGREADKIEPPK